MYMKEPEKCYRYNDAEDADFTKIVDPKHTALLMIDMQNDFCSPKGKFAQAGRAADSIIEIVPACRKLLEAARQANVFVVHIQQSTLPGEQSDNGGWIAFKTRDGKAHARFSFLKPGFDSRYRYQRSVYTDLFFIEHSLL